MSTSSEIAYSKWNYPQQILQDYNHKFAELSGVTPKKLTVGSFHSHQLFHEKHFVKCNMIFLLLRTSVVSYVEMNQEWYYKGSEIPVKSFIHINFDDFGFAKEMILFSSRSPTPFPPETLFKPSDLRLSEKSIKRGLSVRQFKNSLLYLSQYISSMDCKNAHEKILNFEDIVSFCLNIRGSDEDFVRFITHVPSNLLRDLSQEDVEYIEQYESSPSPPVLKTEQSKSPSALAAEFIESSLGSKEYFSNIAPTIPFFVPAIPVNSPPPLLPVYPPHQAPIVDNYLNHSSPSGLPRSNNSSSFPTASPTRFSPNSQVPSKYSPTSFLNSASTSPTTSSPSNNGNSLTFIDYSPRNLHQFTNQPTLIAPPPMYNNPQPVSIPSIPLFNSLMSSNSSTSNLNTSTISNDELLSALLNENLDESTSGSQQSSNENFLADALSADSNSGSSFLKTSQGMLNVKEFDEFFKNQTVFDNNYF